MQASFDEYTNIQRAVSHAGNIHAWFQRSSNRAIMVAMIASVVPARAEWVPIRDESLVISANSALDFSALWPTRPAGALGRVVASSNGALAFENKPDESIRFHCASLAWNPAPTDGFPSKETAELYAEQLQMHGYNAVRFHFVDALLMAGSDKDFDYDAVQLDRFHYFLAALKRHGIYWVMDVMTSPNGAYGNVRPDRWVRRYDLKLDVYLDYEARRHWRRLAETILATRNPYTNLSPLEDPTLALLVLVNENGVEFTSIIDQGYTGAAYPPKLAPKFNEWLNSKYKGTAALRSAWGDLSLGERLEAGSVHLPASREERSPRMRDAQSFFRSIEAETFQWLTREIRALGYPGLISQFNNWATTATSFSRMNLPVVTMNSYFDEVWNFDPGFSISQNSSLDDDANYVREMFSVRWLRRPFVVTEYGQVFWNRYRHEAGIVVPAYAALQGWDLICLHGVAIDRPFSPRRPGNRSIMPYAIGIDPVARAGETLSALLFRRGDVSTARTTVAIPFGQESDMLDAGQGQIPSSLITLGLLVRLGLMQRDDAEISPDSSSPPSLMFESRGSRAQRPATRSVPAPNIGAGNSLMGIRAFARSLSSAEPDAWTPRPIRAGGVRELSRYVSNLRDAGVLSKENQTDPAARIYHSETDEILMDAPRGFFRVVTPRTVAASFERIASPCVLGAMTINAGSGPALVALSSLDGEPVARSAHLLLIFATDARNSNMKFRDDRQRTIESYGGMPVLIRRESVHIQFHPEVSGSWSLSSLHLNGTVGDRLSMTMKDSQVEFRLDNAGTSHGPTTFFRLDRYP
jgi:hypothetical protein